MADIPTAAGFWPQDRDFILRALGEVGIPAGSTVYADFYFDLPLRAPQPTTAGVLAAQEAEVDLRRCLLADPRTAIPDENEPRIARRGPIVRLTYRKTTQTGTLDLYLPFCLEPRIGEPPPPWRSALKAVEFGQVVAWYESPVGLWVAGFAAAAATAAAWAIITVRSR